MQTDSQPRSDDLDLTCDSPPATSWTEDFNAPSSHLAEGGALLLQVHQERLTLCKVVAASGSVKQAGTVKSRVTATTTTARGCTPSVPAARRVGCPELHGAALFL